MSKWIKMTKETLPPKGQPIWVTHVRGYVQPRVYQAPYTEEDMLTLFKAWMLRETEPAPYVEDEA